MTAPHPHDLRLVARTATYPNRQAEREAIAQIDRFVFDKVREHEARIAQVVDRFIAGQAKNEEEAAGVVRRIDQNLRRELLDGGNPTDLAERYETIRITAAAVIRSLRAAADASEFHAQRADDPYISLCEVWTKYPILRPELTGG